MIDHPRVERADRKHVGVTVIRWPVELTSERQKRWHWKIDRRIGDPVSRREEATRRSIRKQTHRMIARSEAPTGVIRVEPTPAALRNDLQQIIENTD